MLRKVFIAFILIFFAATGLYAIGVLTGRIEAPARREVGVDSGIPEMTESEEPEGPLKKVQQALNLDKPNDISFGEVNSGTSLIFLKSVKIEDDGYVVVYDSQNFNIENVVGFTGYLEKGTWDNVSIRFKRILNKGETLYFGFRRDDGDGFFDMSGKYDKNIVRADGRPLLIERQVD